MGLSFWDDVWIPTLGPLRNYVLDPIIPDINLNFQSFIDSHGQWDIPALALIVHQDAISHIVNIKPPCNNDVADHPIWPWSKTLLFEPIERVIQCSVNWAIYYDKPSPVTDSRQVHSQAEPTWSKPLQSWASLNTDGAVSHIRRNGSIGGVIRNSDGLLVAWNTGLKHFIVQSDCSQAINLLSVNNPMRSHHSLVRAIANLCSREWTIRFRWMARTGNKVADCLAKIPPLLHFNMVHYASPPWILCTY
ncbi:hypothetical protein F3Y22_tig00000340pilonHSYRG01599 [Hibiscus syriacus]|uniref:RNase H type-1 domain-containing protein n=1 Tax=Hibiscus syriacus TaxID=106335 RepID=A0A6A3D9A2_HIBSY|nr:hypothetical protein F3Y22_tig00000340pilonHSYRG01599 [Hibiscus syriacus]